MSRSASHACHRHRPLRLRRLGRVRLVPRLLLLAVLMMVGQQMTLAAYACRMPSAAMGSMQAMVSMPSMSGVMHDNCPQMGGVADRWLCAKHCAPDTTVQHDTRSAQVPPSLLGALPPATLELAYCSAAAAAPARHYRLRAPPLPAALLFCSLLI